MRKTLLSTAGILLSALLSACSSGDELTAEEPADQTLMQEDPEEHLFDDIEDDGKMQPIRLCSTVGYSVDVTKGTGTVGANDEDQKWQWQYENIYVLMTTEEALFKGYVKSAPSVLVDDKAKGWGFTTINLPVAGREFFDDYGYQFDNSFWCRPVAGDDGKFEINYTQDPRSRGAMRYYPTQGKSHFFAYYVDDAGKYNDGGKEKPIWDATGEDVNANTVSPLIEWKDNTSSPDKIIVPFQIDGSQDLLSGYASADYKGTPVRKFDSRSARAGVIPVLGMEHMLTRFRFKLTASDLNNTGDATVFGVPGKSSAVTVDSIKVLSRSKGTMTVACKNLDNYPEADNRIAWDETTRDSLFLQQLSGTPASLPDGKQPMVKLEPVTMTKEVFWDDVAKHYNSKQIGEAILVEPNQTSYELFLYTSQTLNLSGDPAVASPYVKKERVDLVIESEDIPKFLRGHSYDVTIYVNSYEEAKLEIKLESWQSGGGISIGEDTMK